MRKVRMLAVAVAVAVPLTMAAMPGTAGAKPDPRFRSVHPCTVIKHGKVVTLKHCNPAK